MHKSRNESLLSLSGSMVNVMCGSMLFMCSVNSTVFVKYGECNVWIDAIDVFSELFLVREVW